MFLKPKSLAFKIIAFIEAKNFGFRNMTFMHILVIDWFDFLYT